MAVHASNPRAWTAEKKDLELEARHGNMVRFSGWGKNEGTKNIFSRPNNTFLRFKFRNYYQPLNFSLPLPSVGTGGGGGGPLSLSACRPPARDGKR